MVRIDPPLLGILFRVRHLFGGDGVSVADGRGRSELFEGR